MPVISVQRTLDDVLTSANAAYLTIRNSASTIVFGPTLVAPTSAGIYSQDTGFLAPASYTATWTFVVAGEADTVLIRPFVVDPPLETYEGVSLMAIEQAVARRIGPYSRHRVAAGSTINSVKVARLQSSLSIGAYEDQFILRRGLMYDGLLVANANANDRTRRVAAHDSLLGALAVDRAYTTAPVENEMIELHALDPEQELRPCVLDGLKRCFMWDTLEISVLGTNMYNVNLTASAPWLASPQHVQEVGYSYTSQRLPPRRLSWWKPYRLGPNLFLSTQGAAAGTLSLTVLRPVYSLVNGGMNMSGPDDDLDVVYVDLDYAAWAGVLECWKNHPEVLQPLAVQNMRPSRQDAATEFSKKSMTLVQQMPEKPMLDFSRPDITQIGNLAEPV